MYTHTRTGTHTHTPIISAEYINCTQYCDSKDVQGRYGEFNVSEVQAVPDMECRRLKYVRSILNVCLCACLLVCVNVCVCVCACVHACVCVYVCTFLACNASRGPN